MPIAFNIDEPNRVVWVRASGIPSRAEAAKTILDLSSNASFRKGHSIILDNRNISRLAVLDTVEAMVCAAMDRVDMFSQSRMAIVVQKDISFGLMTLFAIRAETLRMKAVMFWGMDAALKWLGLDITMSSPA